MARSAPIYCRCQTKHTNFDRWFHQCHCHHQTFNLDAAREQHIELKVYFTHTLIIVIVSGCFGFEFTIAAAMDQSVTGFCVGRHVDTLFANIL